MTESARHLAQLNIGRLVAETDDPRARAFPMPAPMVDPIVMRGATRKRCLVPTIRAVAVVALASCALTACAPRDIDDRAPAGKARVFEPPHVVLDFPDSKGVFVRGNVYYVDMHGKPGAGALVTSGTEPMFRNVEVPNAEDAGTAVIFVTEKVLGVRCMEGSLTATVADLGVKGGERHWSVKGDCK